MNLRERWIQAMSRIPWSLVGYKGYTEQEAHLVCQYFRDDAPLHPKLSVVLALENEAKSLFDSPSAIGCTVPESAVKAKKKKRASLKTVNRVTPNLDDYLTPWCRVIKNEKLIRYEDATGKPIPEFLWPK